MKHKYLGLALLASSLAFVSCKKEFDQLNPQTFSQDNAFQTMEHVQNGTNGAYGRMATYFNDIYKTALTSDEVKIGSGNGGSGLLTYRYQYGSDATTGGDVIGGYYGYYALIDQVNRVLPWIDRVSGGTPERRAVVRGQLLSLRAAAHFGLLNSFSKKWDPNGMGVSIMTASDNAAKPARATMGAVMTQILADFNEAKTLLPDVTAADFTDTVFNKLNVDAFMARIALYRGDYDAAITHATTVINSGIRPLAEGANYTGMWNDLNNGEVLFRIRTLTNTALGAAWTTAGNQITLAPSDKLVASFGPGDIREAAFIGTAGSGEHYVNKHFESPRGPRMVDYKILRMSEMYLIRAEAYAKKATPDIAAGTADLNLLRSKRITPYTNVTFGTAQSLIDAVLEEKFIEMCFEGMRFYDLKRNGLPVERLSSDAAPEWQTLPANNFRFVYPIPRDALQANPNTIQNEGY